MVNIIVAITENNAIGKDNKLLFSLKKDLQNFREVTTGQIVIMGRKTFESIGKPLPNRVNAVITREKQIDGVKIYTSLEEAIKTLNDEYPDKEIFIIGGGQIYKEALDNDLVDTLYMTKIKKEVLDADTYFPSIDYKKKWRISDVKRYFENDIEFFIYKAEKNR